MRFLIPAILTVLSVGCASIPGLGGGKTAPAEPLPAPVSGESGEEPAPQPATPDPATPQPAAPDPAASQPAASEEAAEPFPPLEDSVHWVRNSAEYRALVLQTFRLALERVEELAAGRDAGTWAVALDGDESVISNAQYEKEIGADGHGPAAWDAWVRRREATPLPGALEFLQTVRRLGGRIAIVTNRREVHCPDTRANFVAQQIPFDVILCRVDSGEKEPRWEQVVAGTATPGLAPAEILVWVGDAITDFPDLDQESRFAGDEAFAAFGDRFFIMPNPMYGSWTRNPRQ
ncbi:MAG: HAD family acid phosphatase [Acidobacteriota bacterium]